MYIYIYRLHIIYLNFYRFVLFGGHVEAKFKSQEMILMVLLSV